MDHHIVVVADDALPSRHDWMLVETEDVTVFAIKESALTPDTLAEGWAAYRRIDKTHVACRRAPMELASGATSVQGLPRGA